MRWLIPALALVAAITFFVLSERPSSFGREGGVERPGPVEESTDDVSVDLTAPESTQDRERVAAGGTASEFDGHAARPAPEGEPEPDGLRVRVIDADGQPVPGVDVELTGRNPGADGGASWGTGTSSAPGGIAHIDLALPADDSVVRVVIG